MPYTYENYPETIKELPEKARKIWINTFNSAYSKNKNEASAIRQAWGAVENAGYKKIDNEWRRWQ